MNNPIVSLFMCYRYRVEANRASIIKFIQSVDKYFSNKDEIELMIKLDEDDKVGIGIVNGLITDTSIDPMIKRRFDPFGNVFFNFSSI